jgi:hypothetical protein
VKTWLSLALLLTVFRVAAAESPEASLGPSIIGIDHMPLAVKDLEQASDTYRQLGFSLKPGRLHEDGIRNNHVKFKDGSGIELLSPPNSSADALTAHYLEHLQQGDGASVAAIGAGMIDLDKARGAVANAVAPPIGTGSGAILAGIFVQCLPAPTHLIYEVLGVVFIAQAIGLSFMSETMTPRSGVWKSLKPQLALPRATREPLLLAVPVLIAVWATAGFYGSLGPMLIRGFLGTHSPLLGGLGLFVLAATAGVSVLLLQHREPKHMMTVGAASLAFGAALTVGAISCASITWFFVGTALAGVGFGAGFQGSVRTIVPFAAPHERAGVLSIIFLLSYLSMGAPAVVAGALVARHGNILGVAQGFGAVMIALAVAALIGGAVRNAARQRSQRSV